MPAVHTPHATVDRHGDRSMSDLRRAPPRTWSTPTLSPFRPDAEKYAVAVRLTARLERMAAEGASLADRRIERVVTVNGARVMLEGGAFVRPSSNTPNSDDEMRVVFHALDHVIRQEPSVGDCDQTL